MSLVGGCTQLDCNVGTDRRMIDSSQTRSTDENTKNMLMRWKQNFLIKQTLDSWQFSAQFLLDPVSNNWQLKCLWNPVPMVAPPWPTQTPPIYSLNPSPLSQNMGRTQQVPSSPPLYAIWCSSARVVVDLICWIWSKRNVVLQSVSKCPTDLYNKLLLSFPIWYNIRTDFVRLPLYCCQVALHWCCQTDGAIPIYDWSFLDWRLKEMISWSPVQCSVCDVLVVVTVTSQIWTRDQFWHWQHKKYFTQKMENLWSIVRKGVVAIAAVSQMQWMMDLIEEVQKFVYSRRWRKEPDSGSGSGEI